MARLDRHSVRGCSYDKILQHHKLRIYSIGCVKYIKLQQIVQCQVRAHCIALPYNFARNQITGAEHCDMKQTTLHSVTSRRVHNSLVHRVASHHVMPHLIMSASQPPMFYLSPKKSTHEFMWFWFCSKLDCWITPNSFCSFCPLSVQTWLCSDSETCRLGMGHDGKCFDVL